MGKLQKATLQEIESDEQRTPRGKAMEVQFNPTTLQLTISNQIEGGESRGRQARQYLGSASTVLTCDLIFDSADEGTTETPVSVREKTAMVEVFVLPKTDGKGGKDAPPKLRFQWGELIHEGVVDSITIDFDHFAADGTPLRAKVKLSIKEQNSQYQFLKKGPGANKGAAPIPGSVGLSAGISAGLSLGGGISLGGSLGVSAGISAQASLALGGETAVEFATRMGLDPASWRGLEADLSSSLTFEAGTEVGFSPEMSGNAGLGAQPGALAEGDASPAAAYGLAGGAVAGSGGGSSSSSNSSGGAAVALLEQRQAGIALSAAGGVGAALEAVNALAAQSAAGKARAAFGAPAGPPRPELTARPARPAQNHQPLRSSGARTPAQQAAAEKALFLPAADSRETTFGFGVPLRPRRGGQSSAAAIAGETQPTVPPWQKLPRRAAGRELGEPGGSDCGCGGGCSCGCGGGSGSSGGCGCGSGGHS